MEASSTEPPGSIHSPGNSLYAASRFNFAREFAAMNVPGELRPGGNKCTRISSRWRLVALNPLEAYTPQGIHYMQHFAREFAAMNVPGDFQPGGNKCTRISSRWRLVALNPLEAYTPQGIRYMQHFAREFAAMNVPGELRPGGNKCTRISWRWRLVALNPLEACPFPPGNFQYNRPSPFARDFIKMSQGVVTSSSRYILPYDQGRTGRSGYRATTRWALPNPYKTVEFYH